MALQLHQVATGRVFIRGNHRPMAVLDVGAELTNACTDVPQSVVSLVISGDGAFRDPITLDLDEAVLLAEAITRAAQAFSTIDQTAMETAA